MAPARIFSVLFWICTLLVRVEGTSSDIIFEDITCFTGTGKTYKGCARRSGEYGCEVWNIAKSGKYASIGTHDFCRNPSSYHKPWCYTWKDIFGDWKWGECGIPRCEDIADEKTILTVDSDMDVRANGCPCQHYRSSTDQTYDSDNCITAPVWMQRGHDRCLFTKTSVKWNLFDWKVVPAKTQSACALQCLSSDTCTKFQFHDGESAQSYKPSHCVIEA